MSDDLTDDDVSDDELASRLDALKARKVYDAKALNKARERARGRQIDPSNRSFYASESERFEKLKKEIAGLEAKLEARRTKKR
jgi:hypothetical protein